MKIQIERVDWSTKHLSSLKITSFFLLILATSTSSTDTKCPFNFVFFHGDRFSDVGNSVHIPPLGPSLPPTKPPYGVTFPGKPAGRWSDGVVNADLSPRDFGLPKIAPYMPLNKSRTLDGVIYSVAGSPVLHRKIFTSRGIHVPPYVVSLIAQLKWVKSYLASVCKNPKDCANFLGDSIVLMGYQQGEDIGYPLSQLMGYQQGEDIG